MDSRGPRPKSVDFLALDLSRQLELREEAGKTFAGILSPERRFVSAARALDRVFGAAPASGLPQV